MKSSKDSVSGFAHNKSATTGDDEGEITRVMSMDERPANLSQASIVSRKIHVAANEEMEKNDKRTTTMKSCLKASMVRNIDGKILGKDGKPLAYVRQAVRVSKVQHGMSSDNEGTEDHTWKAVDVHESSNAHDQQEPNRAKPVEMVSYASMINSDLKPASDCVLPMAAMDAIKHKFDNTLVGFFVGKKVAFTLVKNYVVNTWGKFGFQNVIRDDDGFHFFKFASSSGVEKVIEQGPWMIRGTPIILTKWSPSLTISKDEVTRVPVWVKLHRVPVVAYSEDGLSIIATQIGTPITLDAFTSDMCVNPWGRIGFARALIEVSAENDLKKEVILAVPLEDGKGHTNVTIKVEYEWKPPLCLDCHCFGHDGVNCPKKIVAKVSKVSEHEQAAKENDDGFVTVTNKKKKGKSIENPHNRQIEGIKFNKPKSSFVYRPKKASSNTTSDTNQPSSSKESSDAPINLVDLNVPTESVVKLKNSFDALNEDEMVTNDSGQNSISIINESDSEDIDEEITMEEQQGDDRMNTKGASTPVDSVLNV
ncbi:reverse transcriptase domain-containing protein [Tanacetum coccineum]